MNKKIEAFIIGLSGVLVLIFAALVYALIFTHVPNASLAWMIWLPAGVITLFTFGQLPFNWDELTAFMGTCWLVLIFGVTALLLSGLLAGGIYLLSLAGAA